LPALGLDKLSKLEFFEPDLQRFPCLRLAYEAMAVGGTMPAAMSAANEVAVAAFLRRRIRFVEIPIVIEATMRSHASQPCSSIEAVLEADRVARHTAESLVNRSASAVT
jgi:1-deoxy-D-xylulose-5-phosphate reductoisomerase